ncbi:MAG: DNA alkylation repair protein [Gemmatimonadota bacterium]|nr:DNA alkylation repair protein [Gemmatimonadota bacterium]
MNETEERVAGILLQLERRGSERNRAGMARYAITAPKVFGVPAKRLHEIATRLGTDHPLALLLWETGWHEARILAALVDDPARVTGQQMERWARDFDNWAICDTCCMRLFDRTPHAWWKAEVWGKRRAEFVKRAGFALVASLARKDRASPDAPFLLALRWVEREATDDRNFVRKAVNWALRAIGERNTRLSAAARTVAASLATSTDRTARWIGRDALRQFGTPASRARVARAMQAAAKGRAPRRRARAAPRGPRR